MVRKLNRRTFPALRRAALVGVATAPAFLVGAASLGAVATWSNTNLDGNANWSSTGNWSTGIAPGSTDLTVASSDTVTFGNVALSSQEMPVLDASRRIIGMNIDNTGADYDLNASGSVTLAMSGHLTVTGGGVTTINPTINLVNSSAQRFNTGSSAVTLAGGLVFAAGRTLILVNSVPLSITGNLQNVSTSAGAVFAFDGTGAAVISGNILNGTQSTGIEALAAFTGNVRLTGTNAFSADITWRAGTLELGSAGAGNSIASSGARISLGTTTAGSAEARLVVTDAVTVARGVFVNSTAKNAIITLGGTNTSGVATYAGGIGFNTTTVNAFNMIASGGGTVDFAAGISSSVTSLNKTGLGTVRFTNAAGNSYTGRTSVAAGTLLVANTTNSGTGGSIVQVGDGAVFGGQGRAGNTTAPVTVFGGGTLRGGTGAAASGALTIIGDLVMSDTSRIQLAVGNSGTHSSLARTGVTSVWTFDDDQRFDLIGIGTVTAGQTYDNIITGLASAPGAIDVNNVLTQWQILGNDFAGTFSWDGANVDLTTTAAPEPASLSLLALGGAAMLRRKRRETRTI